MNNLTETPNFKALKIMEKLHHKINLRADLIDILVKNEVNKYGKNSATVKSKYFYPNIGLFISYLLKEI